MGWWKIVNVESGGIDISLINKQGIANITKDSDPEDIEFVMGDDPADDIGSAIHEVIANYKNLWGNAPTRTQLLHCYNFAIELIHENLGSFVSQVDSLGIVILAVKEMIKDYNNTWNRDPNPTEFQACFNFVTDAIELEP